MNKINLKIVTPEKLVYENIVDEIYASTHSGVIGILPEHFPLVTALKPGEIRVKEKGTEVPMAVSGGILEVRPMQKSEDGFVTEVIILADRLEFSHEIDIKRAKEAYERAKKAMEEKENMADIDFARVQSNIEKELNRIKVATKYRGVK